MKQQNIFVPGNISLIFKICSGPNPEAAGSLGVGFTINKGVEVSIRKSEKTKAHSANSGQVFWNGEKIDFPTVKSVVRKLTYSSSESEVRIEKPFDFARYKTVHGFAQGRNSSRLTGVSSNNNNITVYIDSDLPLGCGFGLSGASALGAAYAINDLFSLGKSKLELAKIAHIAEVENGTGLGDVTNEFFGGFLLKTVPSSQFLVHKIPIANIPIYVRYFSKLSTKDIITDNNKRKKIDMAGEKAIKKVQETIQQYTLFPRPLRERVRVRGEKRTSKQLLSKGSSLSQQGGTLAKKELLSKILQISKQFAMESGLLTERQVIETIEKIESGGGHATMIMLGNAIVADIPFEGSIKLEIQ